MSCASSATSSSCPVDVMPLMLPRGSDNTDWEPVIGTRR